MEKYTGLRIYAIGKIKKDCWRHDIAPIRNAFFHDLDDPTAYSWPDGVGIPNLPGAVYAGPFFMSDDHGCYHKEFNSHGVAAGGAACGGAYPGMARPDVVQRCFSAIESATHIFAWIDDPTAYGSLVEIGYARGIGKPVHLYFQRDVDLIGLWFAAHVTTSFTKVANVAEAWADFSLRLTRRSLLEL
jgi:hypothetical protein